VKYPVRFVNCTLQGKIRQAGKETGKFVVNTVGGIGGIFRPAEKIPALANLPDEDTAQTFAKWGIPNGPYLVLPVLGPSSVRDGVGLVGDYALNPVNWPYLWWYGSRTKHDWVIVPPLANTLRSTPAQMDKYDTITKDAVDPYLSARRAANPFGLRLRSEERTQLPLSTCRVARACHGMSECGSQWFFAGRSAHVHHETLESGSWRSRTPKELGVV
jgi:ABC-type transporter lipoprotein component MlaA